MALRCHQVAIAEDAALCRDARGALSHHFGRRGTYGYLTSFEADAAVLKQLREELAADPVLRVRFAVADDATNKGGLAIFGQKLGRYPTSPTVRFTMQAAPAAGP